MARLVMEFEFKSKFYPKKFLQIQNLRDLQTHLSQI